MEDKIQHGITEEDENEVKYALKEIHENEPGIFSQLHDLIVKGAVSGTVGHFLSQWITAIAAGFTK